MNKENTRKIGLSWMELHKMSGGKKIGDHQEGY